MKTTAPTVTDLIEAILASFSKSGEFNNLTATHGTKEIRAMAAKLAKAKPTRVVIRVKGGLVADVYSSDAQANVAVLDQDLLDEGDPTLDEGRMQDARDLEVEVKSLTEVR